MNLTTIQSDSILYPIHCTPVGGLTNCWHPAPRKAYARLRVISPIGETTDGPVNCSEAIYCIEVRAGKSIQDVVKFGVNDGVYATPITREEYKEWLSDKVREEEEAEEARREAMLAEWLLNSEEEDEDPEF
jgi:hypothetical protein